MTQPNLPFGQDGGQAPGTAHTVPGAPAVLASATPATPQQRVLPGWATLLGAVLIGAGLGVVAVLAQGWSAVLTSPGIIVIPWGAVLGALAVFAGAVAWGLRTAQRWVPGVVGLCAFVVLGLVSMDSHNVLLAPLDPRYFQVAPGAVWSSIVVVAGVVAGTLAALLVVAKYTPPAPRRR